MARLFIFGIGGTGSRIIKALTMLMASGIEVPNTSEIVPIIIDPDAQNGDMTRTVEILNDYQKIYDAIEHTQNGFFKTKITTLKKLAEQSGTASVALAETFQYNINGTKEGRFREFIDYSLLDETNKALVDLLYPENLLNLSLDEGFKGNPNIGAVVLNQFKYSNELKQFANLFQAGDRIFIISSIFGGTGAAGFPLLLKNLRNADAKELANHKLIQDAPIGAVTVMPYFGVEPKAGGMIDKGTFISKTKSALSYYYRTMCNTGALNALYYIGDEMKNSETYAEGRGAQTNRAHLVEMVSALGIIDFMRLSANDVLTTNGKSNNPIYREFGIKDDADPMSFLNLEDQTRNQLFKPMTQFGYFALYLRQKFSGAVGAAAWSKNGAVKIDAYFVGQPFFQTLNGFIGHYWAWLDEMARNQRGFAPFNMNTTDVSLTTFVRGMDQKKGFLGFGGFNYDNYTSYLDTAEKELSQLPAEQKLLAIFYRATANILKDKY